ncbi:MAG TPA: hypothetical protein VGM41_16565 [Chitinophagaceae bacterium]|jgi:hypothetical protein
MKKAKIMLMATIALAVAGAGLAYKAKEASPVNICYTTDLDGDTHTCNLVYEPTIEPVDSFAMYYTFTDDTAQCKKGIPCSSYTIVR